jgi:hypothetical protein
MHKDDEKMYRGKKKSRGPLEEKMTFEVVGETKTMYRGNGPVRREPIEEKAVVVVETKMIPR